ncbi:MAG TPA: LysR family transcriptional regulator [Polyangiaceae bacterium]|nr:LysR family transcriptional regulator [Polyangiaceae bacterium]
MDRLALMQAFVAVAEAEGFAPAARRLGVSPPVVTRSIAALEEHLGTRLLERTTRKVRITEAGARYLGDCKRLLAELEDAEAAVRGAHETARGSLGVTASAMFGRMFVSPILVEFLAKYPQVTARALLVDRVVDLIDEGLDVAIRIAHLDDSSLTSVKVGAVRRITCASPSYLKKHGVPRVPRDLADHRTFVFSNERTAPAWAFEQRGKPLSFRPRAALLANTSEVGIEAAVAGFGVTRALSYMVASHVHAGRLRIILQDYEAAPIPIHVVYREGRRAPARVRAFIDFVVPRLRQSAELGLDLAAQTARPRTRT